MVFPWWFWLILAIFLFIFEILTPTLFFSACLGCAALVTALISLVINRSSILWLIFFTVSLLLIILTRPLAKRLTKKQIRAAGIGALIGQKALVVEPINPVTKKGIVKIEGEEWLAEAEANIEKNEWVEILRVEGTKVIVKKLGT